MRFDQALIDSAPNGEIPIYIDHNRVMHSWIETCEATGEGTCTWQTILQGIDQSVKGYGSVTKSTYLFESNSPLVAEFTVKLTTPTITADEESS